MALVRARQSIWVTPTRLVPAGAILHDHDPVVTDRAELFEPVEVAAVEQATAAPGERRAVKKAPAKKAAAQPADED